MILAALTLRISGTVIAGFALLFIPVSFWLGVAAAHFGWFQ